MGQTSGVGSKQIWILRAAYRYGRYAVTTASDRRTIERLVLRELMLWRVGTRYARLSDAGLAFVETLPPVRFRDRPARPDADC